MKFTGQAGQDKWVTDFFEKKKNGYFLDIGAYDGVQWSNTYCLEKELNWSGLLVEASLDLCNQMKFSRSQTIVQKAIYKENTILKFKSNRWAGSINNEGSEIVEAITFEKLLRDYNSPKIIDYISLDIEGGEIDALLGFPFDEYISILWTIEHNVYYGNREMKDKIYEILSSNNYIRAYDNVCSGGDPKFPFEDWYVHKNYIK